MTVKITDTTMRDGHQSLLATRMLTGPTSFLVPLGLCLFSLACGSSDPSPTAVTASGSPSDTSCGTIDQVPFASQLVIPPDARGLRLGNACWSESSQSQSAYLFYGSEDGQGELLIEIYSGNRAQTLRLEGLPTIQLDDLVAQVSDEAEPGGGALYIVQFDKHERLYRVAAEVGVNNPITREDIDAIALSIAEK